MKNRNPLVNIPLKQQDNQQNENAEEGNILKKECYSVDKAQLLYQSKPQKQDTTDFQKEQISQLKKALQESLNENEILKTRVMELEAQQNLANDIIKQKNKLILEMAELLEQQQEEQESEQFQVKKENQEGDLAQKKNQELIQKNNQKMELVQINTKYEDQKRNSQINRKLLMQEEGKYQNEDNQIPVLRGHNYQDDDLSQDMIDHQNSRQISQIKYSDLSTEKSSQEDLN